jgi:hypothetical protein
VPAATVGMVQIKARTRAALMAMYRSEKDRGR